MSVNLMCFSHISVHQMSVGQMFFDQMPFDQMSVDQMSVNQMSVGKMFSEQLMWHNQGTVCQTSKSDLSSTAEHDQSTLLIFINLVTP